MADLEFTREDIEELTGKLNSVAGRHSATERDLLLAIFATAATRAGNGPDTTTGTLPTARVNDNREKAHRPEDLRDQLLKAYIPGPPPSVSWWTKVTPPPAPYE